VVTGARQGRSELNCQFADKPSTCSAGGADIAVHVGDPDGAYIQTNVCGTPRYQFQPEELLGRYLGDARLKVPLQVEGSRHASLASHPLIWRPFAMRALHPPAPMIALNPRLSAGRTLNWP
jgi:hypothetical protein